ncbi:low temperature requirement protein A [Nocardia sp. NPDC127526]|uniref:low temperature requirement protein A n=1 Tax=Nocardia sp. NPDC127526 TaxID=3345393 RepID=UPI0036447477
MTTDTPPETAETHERHASWMELFFDLVAVAGIAQLTHLLHHGPTLGDFALYGLLYLAFWMVWAVVMLYGNIARDHTRVTLMLAAMLGLGVMAAAVAGLPERHATAFAAVYVIVRIASGRIWGRGKIVVDWPTIELGAGILPWLVSLWVPAPWKYVCWAVGLAIDLWVMFAVSGEKLLAEAQSQFDRRLRRMRRTRAFDESRVPKLEAVHADPAHLGERLGLYVIIVLGEGVIAVINAVGGVPWNARVLTLGFASFVILAGLWALTLLYGGVVARLLGGSVPESVMPRRHIMAMHCFLTGAIATIAGGLGLSIDHAAGHLTTGIGWTLCGGAAAYFIINAVVGLRTRPGWKWSLIWPVPCALVAVGLVIFAPHIGALGVVCALAGLILWPLLWESRADRMLRREHHPG